MCLCNITINSSQLGYVRDMLENVGFTRAPGFILCLGKMLRVFYVVKIAVDLSSRTRERRRERRDGI